MSLSTYVRHASRRIKARPSVMSHDWTVPHYEPVNAKARQFHASTSKVNILPGGNQSGKTTTVAHDHVMYARTLPSGCQGLALTNTYRDIGKNLWPHYKECMHPEEWAWGAGNQKTDNPTLIFLKKNGYKFYFGSYEQGRTAHQGSIWDYVHFDEEAPPEIWLEVYRGTLAHKARIGYSYTPLEGYDYLEELLDRGIDPSNAGTWTPDEPMTLMENPHVSQEEKDQWIAMLSEQSRESRVYGRLSNPEGLVYKNFNSSRDIIEPFPIPNDWTIYRGLDFGKEHPTVSTLLAYDGYTVYVISEYYQRDRLVEYHVDQMWQQKLGIPFIEQEYNRFIETISDHDAQLRLEYENPKFGEKQILSTPAKKDRIAGVEVMQSIIEQGRLKVFSDCTYTLWEFKKYHYPGKDGKGRLKPGEKADDPVKEFDDCMDTIRYVLVHIFGFVQWSPDDILTG